MESENLEVRLSDEERNERSYLEGKLSAYRQVDELARSAVEDIPPGWKSGLSCFNQPRNIQRSLDILPTYDYRGAALQLSKILEGKKIGDSPYFYLAVEKDVTRLLTYDIVLKKIADLTFQPHKEKTSFISRILGKLLPNFYYPAP